VPPLDIEPFRIPLDIEPFRIPLDIEPFDIEPLDILPFDIEPFDIEPFDMLPFDIEPFDIEPFDIEPFDIEPFDMLPFDIEPFDIEPFDIEPFDIEPFEFIIFEFIIFEFIRLALVLVFAVSQAIPNAPKANTAERAKVFFICIYFSCLLKRFNLLFANCFLGSHVPRCLNFGTMVNINSWRHLVNSIIAKKPCFENYFAKFFRLKSVNERSVLFKNNC
jgi:hypothetical protein